MEELSHATKQAIYQRDEQPAQIHSALSTPDYSPPLPMVTQATQPAPMSTGAVNDISAQSSQVPALPVASESVQTRELPQNTNLAHGMQRQDLPVFTSTSAIPFAVKSDPPSTVHAASQAVSGTYDPSIWEFHETPHR